MKEFACKTCTCNKCKNMIHRSSPVGIYSGYLCDRGLWDDRGAHLDESELNESEFDNPFNYFRFDPWNNCQRFSPINFRRFDNYIEAGVSFMMDTSFGGE